MSSDFLIKSSHQVDLISSEELDLLHCLGFNGFNHGHIVVKNVLFLFFINLLIKFWESVSLQILDS